MNIYLLFQFSIVLFIRCYPTSLDFIPPFYISRFDFINAPIITFISDLFINKYYPPLLFLDIVDMFEALMLF